MPAVQQAEVEALFLSRYKIKRPLATDTLSSGIRQTGLQEALKQRYIQTNPGSIVYSLVLDVDHADALYRAYNTDLPTPSWVAQSPSGRAHAGYMLKVPFRTDAPEQRKAASLAARVEEGLRRRLDADPGYAGLITKNPIHEDWDTLWGTPELHSLAGMAEQLGKDLPKPLARKRGAESEAYAGLGRNCLLFEETRQWAYTAFLRYSKDSLSDFMAAVHDHVTILNSQLSTPLPESEVRSIANSISRWTWKNFSEANFSAIQTRRSVKGNSVKTARALEREAQVLMMREEGWKWQGIADTLGMSLRAAQSIGLRAKKRG